MQEELREVFGDDADRDVTSEDLAKLKYLSKCIKESMRLYTPIPAVTRSSEYDLEVEVRTIKTAHRPVLLIFSSQDMTIPAGTELVIYLFHHHRDPSAFPNPTKFDPDRFSGALDSEPGQRPPFAYIPFSAGARNCLGQKFAEMEQKVALATILRRYSISTDLSPEELDKSLSVSFTLNSEAVLLIT